MRLGGRKAVIFITVSVKSKDGARALPNDHVSICSTACTYTFDLFVLYEYACSRRSFTAITCSF